MISKKKKKKRYIVNVVLAVVGHVNGSGCVEMVVVVVVDTPKLSK